MATRYASFCKLKTDPSENRALRTGFLFVRDKAGYTRYKDGTEEPPCDDL
jgi:hypothetical protein